MTVSGQGHTRRPPRLNHKKSRAGCQRCKARRVKCDEAKPACGGCTRHDVPCQYASDHSQSTNSSISTHSSPLPKVHLDSATSQTITPPTNDDSTNDDPLDIPESRERRLLELRLWHNYVTAVAHPFHPAAPKPPIIEIWNNHVPHLALQHENLLNAIYAISATNLLRFSPDDTDLVTAHRTYLSLALREQRKAVAQLEQQAEEADAVCFASILMTTDAFGSLQERNRNPYIPPIDMLYLGQGAYAVFAAAMKTARKLPSSNIVTFVEGQPFYKNLSTMFDQQHRTPFLSILGAKDDHGVYEDHELQDPDVLDAYERTLSYIGTMFKAVQDNEALQPLCVRIASFALLTPRKFIEMVEEGRPRALVILAHFFALATKGSAHWWVGQTPMREVQGLRRIVPLEWQRHMRWPLVMSGLEPV